MQQHRTFCGLVLRETDFSEADTYLTVLCDSGEKVEVLCRSLRRRGNRMRNALRLFCYSELTVYESRGKLTLNDASLHTSFWNLTQDIVRYTLACYFLELVSQVAETDEHDANLTRLILYALHALTKGKADARLVKATFEIRLTALAGFAMQVQACAVCQCHPVASPQLLPKEGICVCATCANGRFDHAQALLEGVYHALCYALGAPVEKLFSFTLGATSLVQFAHIAEDYVLHHLDGTFASLPLYHSFL